MKLQEEKYQMEWLRIIAKGAIMGLLLLLFILLWRKEGLFMAVTLPAGGFGWLLWIRERNRQTHAIQENNGSLHDLEEAKASETDTDKQRIRIQELYSLLADQKEEIAILQNQLTEIESEEISEEIKAANKTKLAIGQKKDQAEDITLPPLTLDTMTLEAQIAARNTAALEERMEASETERKKLAERVGGMAEELSGQVVVCLAEAEQAISTAIEGFTRIAGEAQEAATLAQRAVGAEATNSVSTIAVRATDVMDAFIGGMLTSARKIAEASRRLERLGGLSDRLFTLLDDVEGVADKTMLVALNASIEAARAGNAGRTFAVVAKEVSKLAQTSRQTAESMRAMTDELSQETKTIYSDLSMTAENSLEESCNAQLEVNRLLELLSAADQDTQSLMTQLGTHSHNITVNYASIVMAFQFHDLLRQRLEHVAEPLADLSASLCSEREGQRQESLAYAVGERHFRATAVGTAPTLEVVTYSAKNVAATTADDDDNITLF